MVAEDVARAATLVAMAQAVQPDAEDVLVAVAEVAQAQERWSDLALTAQPAILILIFVGWQWLFFHHPCQRLAASSGSALMVGLVAVS
jgi:hypothetical protein